MAAVRWRVSTRGSRGWGRRGRQPIAQADVVAPDGRRYVVWLVRVFWGGTDSRVSGVLGNLLPNPISFAVDVVNAVFTPGHSSWGVRVFREGARFRSRSLVYGEEFSDFHDSVVRAREIANDLAAGGRP
jgi:hypothetical protein